MYQDCAALIGSLASREAAANQDRVCVLTNPNLWRTLLDLLAELATCFAFSFPPLHIATCNNLRVPFHLVNSETTDDKDLQQRHPWRTKNESFWPASVSLRAKSIDTRTSRPD
jgi:hypothetical protein